MPRVLIVEDEADMARGLEFNLQARGYDVVVARDGETACEVALTQPVDLVLLDLMLPKLDGYEVCRAIRKDKPDLPVVMLTARSQEDEVVLGLKLGADDYVKKPFGVAELVARIEAVLRRAQSHDDGLGVVELGDVVVDFEHHTARKGDEAVALTPKEFEILRYFVRHRGEIVTRDALLQAAWGYTSYPNSRTVDTHLVKLRQKIEDDPHVPRHLLTVHGMGYKFIG
jgi:DNA-binding response OmpR family regulator